MKYYFDKSTSTMYLTDEILVYKMACDFNELLELYFKYDAEQSDNAWVRNFGKVPMGICTEYKDFGLNPSPQVKCKYIDKFLVSNRSKWFVDWEKSLSYSIIQVSKWVNQLCRENYLFSKQ